MSTLLENPLTDTLQLSYEQTVPRSLVHKRWIENVLLTEVRGRGDQQFICAGRIPTVHQFFNETGRTPYKDILFYTELGRQASLAVSHTFLGVSTEDVFIFEQSQAWMKEAAWGAALRSRSDSAISEIQIREIERRKNNAVNRVVAEQIMSIGGEEVFRGTGAWTIQPAALFQRLRRLSRTRTAPASNHIDVADASASTDGFRRLYRDNVVIFVPQSDESRMEFAAALIVDKTNPYFFDHPCDHVPGMLMLEGCTQLALAAVADAAALPLRQLVVSGYDVNFQQFVECDAPVTLTAHLDATVASPDRVMPATVHITISQQNVVSGTATLSVALPL